MDVSISFLRATLFNLIQSRWATFFNSIFVKMIIYPESWKEWNYKKLFRGSACRSYLVRLIRLGVSDWFKCGEDFDKLANDVGEL